MAALPDRVQAGFVARRPFQMNVGAVNAGQLILGDEEAVLVVIDQENAKVLGDSVERLWSPPGRIRYPSPCSSRFSQQVANSDKDRIRFRLP